MQPYLAPGVYKEEVFLEPAAQLPTGVPALLGFAAAGPYTMPQALRLWTDFEKNFGKPLPDSFLGHAVRGFFENGGRLCYVVRLQDTGDRLGELQRGLNALRPLDTLDLVCAPDIMQRIARVAPAERVSSDMEELRAMQLAVLAHCDSVSDRFAILDALPRASVDDVLQQRQELSGRNGALYYPWIRIAQGPIITHGFVPPCGHISGIYAVNDQRTGVHKAPANDILEGVLDLEVNLSDVEQGRLNPEGINCLRSFSGRGIRVWGARSLSRESEWIYVSVRRLFLTAGRWIEQHMAAAVFEPNVPALWARITRELTAYFTDLFRRGALMGRTPQESFYVKCDEETNPPEVRELGHIVTEIGLAPALPNEFVIVRIVFGPNGVTISGPTRAG